jgi:hypothetical protein
MVSKEIRYVIDYTTPAGNTRGVLVPGSLTFNGNPIDDLRTYHIATRGYIMGVEGGADDGYGVYLVHGANYSVTGTPLNRAVINYIYDLCYQVGGALSAITPETDGRVTFIGGLVQ